MRNFIFLIFATLSIIPPLAFASGACYQGSGLPSGALNQCLVHDGSEWIAGSCSSGASPLTTNGDLFTFTGGIDARLAIGAANTVLRVSGAGALGYAKLTADNLDAAAGIAYSQMANLTNSILLCTDGSGDPVACTGVSAAEAAYIGTLSSDAQAQIDGKASVTHASAHIDGGSDAIDGDKVEITYSPAGGYTRSQPAQADSDDDLAAHLKGIADALASLISSVAGKLDLDGDGLIEVIELNIDAPTVREYVLDASAAFPYTIDDIVTDCVSGSVTSFDLEINGTNVTGVVADDMTTTKTTDTATAANAVVAGDRVTLVVNSISAPTFCETRTKTTRD